MRSVSQSIGIKNWKSFALFEQDKENRHISTSVLLQIHQFCWSMDSMLSCTDSPERTVQVDDFIGDIFSKWDAYTESSLGGLTGPCLFNRRQMRRLF